MVTRKPSRKAYRIRIECIAIYGKRIVGRMMRILQNTLIVSNGIDTEVIRKKDFIEK